MLFCFSFCLSALFIFCLLYMLFTTLVMYPCYFYLFFLLGFHRTSPFCLPQLVPLTVMLFLVGSYDERQQSILEAHFHCKAWWRLPGGWNLPHQGPKWHQADREHPEPASCGAGVHLQTTAGGQTEIWYSPLCPAEVLRTLRDLYSQRWTFSILYRALSRTHSQKFAPGFYALNQLFTKYP